MERCPRCGGQLLSCDCLLAEYQEAEVEAAEGEVPEPEEWEPGQKADGQWFVRKTGETPNLICDCQEAGNNETTARQIAALPQLLKLVHLEALKRIDETSLIDALAAAERFGLVDDYTSGRSWDELIQEAAQAALAKVEGRNE